MGLALAIVAAISLLAAGMGLFTYALRRGPASRLRYLRAARASETRALPNADIPPDLSDIMNRSRELRIELDAIARYGEQIATIERAIQIASVRRRTLWNRLQGARYDYALARAGDELRAWLAAYEALTPAAQQILQTLDLSATAIHALLERELELELEDQQPERFAAELTRAQVALRRFEHELACYHPHAYR
jgi:hypothetical protein